MSEPTHFSKIEMEVIYGSIELTLNSWNSWLANDNLPSGWSPEHAEYMIGVLEGIVEKFNAVSGKDRDEEEIEEELPNNVLHFPFGGEE
jgi:hypothetical protein